MDQRSFSLQTSPSMKGCFRRATLARTAVLAVLCSATAARANGAFPDSQVVLVPSGAPEEIILGTNFGLVSSEDGGAAWDWICESPVVSFASYLNASPQAAQRLYAIGRDGLGFSDDEGCSWHLAGGTLAGALTIDAFADPGGT